MWPLLLIFVFIIQLKNPSTPLSLIVTQGILRGRVVANPRFFI